MFVTTIEPHESDVFALSRTLTHSHALMTRASHLRGFLVALFSLLALRVDARYRGRAVGGRRISGRGIGPRAADRVGIGRKLLESYDSNDATEVAPVLREDGHCVVAYDQIARRPELSELKRIIDTLPRIKDKLQDPTRVFTLFCPTNDAIEKLRAWEDWEAARRDLVDAFGSTRLMRAYLLAYHAVPNATYTMSQLEQLRGDDRFLEDYLNNVMPLYVVEQKANGVVISGLGSDARIVEADIRACGAILHSIDHVLLPFDGDDEFDGEQVSALISATDALRKRYGQPPLTAEEKTSIQSSDDPVDAVGAVDIESVPSAWTEAAYEYEDDD